MHILIDDIEQHLWVAAVDKGRLQGLEIDPVNELVRWGSVYWGRVERIDKALDAAFINLDGDQFGLLNNADAFLIDSKGQPVKDTGDTAIGKKLKPGAFVLVQTKEGKIAPLDGDENFEDIDLPDKHPRLSMNITMPGRFLVYAPFEKGHRVSQRIREKTLRKRLEQLLNATGLSDGFILRASGVDTQNDVLIRESKILQAMWGQIQKFSEGADPQLIMLGPDALQRMLSDQAMQTITRIDGADADLAALAEEWCDLFAPELLAKIKFQLSAVDSKRVRPSLDFLSDHDLMSQIESLLSPYVLMEGGANIILQQTAALLAVDINRGADKRSSLAINTDAVKEIGRQMRLRNVGGAVLVDFLKMKSKKEEASLLEALNDMTDLDPCTVQIHGFTKLGMVELTRQRRTPALITRLENLLEFE
ncbi:MAG: ribonuclease E [Alphaproteobacteria bacterium]|nr:ribonuclease E [Alphaproteobacteria bacterium]